MPSWRTRDWLTTTTPSAWLEHQPAGRAGSTCPPARTPRWASGRCRPTRADASPRCSTRTIAEGRPEARWLRGGFWRNFQVKYREINDLHKQMLRTSAAVEALPEGPARDAATDHLYRGQSNDCYWHGVFGGIYLSHMRLATLEHLIAAQDICDRQGREQGLPVDGIRSLDAGPRRGRRSWSSRARARRWCIKPSEGAGIGTWDIRATRHALASVLRRRPEAYHAKLVEFESGDGRDARRDGRRRGVHPRHRQGPRAGPRGAAALRPPRAPVGAGPHPGHRRPVPRRSPRSLAPDLSDLAEGRYTVLEATPTEVVVERASEVRIEGASIPVLVTKRFRFDGDRRSPGVGLEVTIRHRGDAPLAARLALGWSLNLLGGGGNPAAWWDTGDGRVAFDTTGAARWARPRSRAATTRSACRCAPRPARPATSGGRAWTRCPSPRTASSGPTRAVGSHSCGRSTSRRVGELDRLGPAGRLDGVRPRERRPIVRARTHGPRDVASVDHRQRRSTAHRGWAVTARGTDR